MIIALSEMTVRQRCGACQNEADIAINALFVGAGDNVRYLSFPPCAVCGAVEFGTRQSSDSNPDHFNSEACGAVNMIHRLAIERGAPFHPTTTPAVRASIAQERGEQRWSRFRPKRVFEVDATMKPVRSEFDEFKLPDEPPEQPPRPKQRIAVDFGPLPPLDDAFWTEERKRAIIDFAEELKDAVAGAITGKERKRS